MVLFSNWGALKRSFFMPNALEPTSTHVGLKITPCLFGMSLWSFDWGKNVA